MKNALLLCLLSALLYSMPATDMIRTILLSRLPTLLSITSTIWFLMLSKTTTLSVMSYYSPNYMNGENLNPICRTSIPKRLGLTAVMVESPFLTPNSLIYPLRN
jgi:hypothetical protein